jgi:N-acetylglucosaminyldiphosphoundecaprenol N-acetyl-beta-D-mannosaminyltransferase
MKTAPILAVSFDALDNAAALEAMLALLQTERGGLVVTPNPEALMLARRDPEFLRALQGAELVFADGIGVLIAARIRRIPVPCRLPGCDMALALVEAAAREGYSVYLLGAAPGVASRAKERLEEAYPGLRVLGAADGFFNEAGEQYILEKIRELAPDILLVGMGMPRQELWAYRRLGELPCKLTMCVGGSLDVFAGNLKRAPKVMQRLGLEWLYRTVKQPSRIRRLAALPRFLFLILFGREK